MANWADEEIRDAETLIDLFKTQVSIIKGADLMLEFVEKQFRDLDCTLSEYRRKMCNVVRLRETLGKVNDSLSKIGSGPLPGAPPGASSEASYGPVQNPPDNPTDSITAKKDTNPAKPTLALRPILKPPGNWKRRN